MSAASAIELELEGGLDAAEAPGLSQISELGKDVLQSVQQIRDLLSARSEALEDCRETLVGQHHRLVVDRERFDREQELLCDEYEKREHDLVEREKRYAGVEDRIQELGRAFQIEADALQTRADELGGREATLAERTRRLDEKQSTLAAMEADFAEQKQQFEERIASLDSDREKLRVTGIELDEARARFVQERDQLEAEREDHRRAAEALESERSAIEESRRDLEERRRQVAEQVESLERREVQVVEQQGTLELRIQQVAQQKEDLIQLRRRWEEKMAEINTASTNLSALREQLASEVGHITNERNELLTRFGLAEKGRRNGHALDEGLPTVREPQASAAAERYQKLCRDARRRAIGAI